QGYAWATGRAICSTISLTSSGPLLPRAPQPGCCPRPFWAAPRSPLALWRRRSRRRITVEGGKTMSTTVPGCYAGKIFRVDLTNCANNTQANGFFGANLKYSGYDAIVLQGRAPSWVYLYIRDDTVELRDASALLGKDTWETQQALEQTLNLTGHQLSVYTSGIAGENQVRFAAIHGDYGHVASKNGCGAVMGNKRLKAVAIVRGSKALSVTDPRGLWLAADEIAHDLQFDPSTQSLYEY